MRRSFAVGIPSMILSLSVFLVTSCSYVTPEAENPNPELLSTENCSVREGVLSCKKSFFGYEINESGLSVDYQPKTWLCGWAPVTQSGGWQGAGGLSNTPYRSRHCNVEMRIAKDGQSLQAKLINLNFPGDFERWQTLFSIPITQHFYYEKDVDSRGRELNRYKKVADRANWKLRPWIDLDIKNIQFEDIFKQPYGFWGGRMTDAFDVEATQEDGDKAFFAFSGSMRHGLYGSLIAHTFRFNFLEIKDNPNFKPTPYNSRNAKHMNILHILGYQPTGNRAQEVNWAAHWDISKPVEFCLNGFPEDNRGYRDIGAEVIDEMNKAMEKIGAVPAGQKAFVVSKRKMKYHFDLRCPAITWVDDPILSFRAPLGIGLVNTNIKTGEILWGGAVIWGGLIDYIVNRDSESTADALAHQTHAMLQDIEMAKHNPYYEDLSAQLNLSNWSRGFKNLNDFVGVSMNQHNAGGQSTIADVRDRLTQQLQQFEGAEEAQKQELMREMMSQLEDITAVGNLNIEGHDIAPLSMTDDDLLFDSSYAQVSENDFLSDLNQAAGLEKKVSYNEQETESRDLVLGASMTMEKAEQLVREFLSDQSMAYDADNRVENHYDAVSAAVAGMSGMEKLAAAQSFIKNVTLHELGHVVGLGHQFEGNRMPEKGMVPAKVYNELAAEVDNRLNYTSIMDYMSGHTEVSLPRDKVVMGAQDELTLAYLYKQQYSSYKAGDENWKFFDVPANGVIPNQTMDDGNVYQTRYMPQCSDIEAWLATSPYCRRWDRGHDAPTLVEENLKEYTDSFVSRLNSFTEATGGNPFWARYRLWSSTYNLMNYNRTFYDQMRYQLTNNEVYLEVFDKIKKDESALLNFSKACIDPSLAPNRRFEVEFAKLSIQPLMSSADVNTVEALQSQQTNASYRTMVDQYKAVLGERNTRELDDAGFAALEADLNENGLAFTELQKLCRASKKSLEVAKLLLSLKGPDHPIMNYDTAIVPTGLRGGEASSDWSRVFGTYDQLGLLPVKIAALDVLTATSSTLQYGWWRVGKPIYNDSNEGKFGYFSMYPEEFTDVVGTAVKNNMGFGGTQLQDSATMSIANLYMNYFLFRTFFWSNDNQARGFKTNYIEELKAQTKFSVSMSAVLLESIDQPGKASNLRFGFRPKLFNFAQRKLIDLPEAYALPDRKVIVKGNEQQIIMPLTKMRFLSQDAAYVWALEVTYDKTSYDDPLQGFTVKNSIAELTTRELSKCMDGNAGLGSFFKENTDFGGFLIGPNIATDPDAQTNFEKSLNDAFEAYQSREELTPTQWGCEESLNGVGLITSTALSLNGFYLPHVFEYIKK